MADYGISVKNDSGESQIDSKYRDEWKVRFKYIGFGKPIRYTHITYDKLGKLIEKLVEPMALSELNIYKVGDRIAQIYFEKVYDAEVSGVIEGTDSREGGFGSTGNK